MNLITQLLQWALKIKNQTQPEGNTETLVGGLFEAIVNYLKNLEDKIGNLHIGLSFQNSVDSYNDTTEGKSSLLNTYPNTDEGWAVLVLHDETKSLDENGEYPSTLYVWNGTEWIDLGVDVNQDTTILSHLKIISSLEYFFAIVSKDQQVLQAIERTTGKTVFPNQKLLDKTSAENHIFSIYDSLKRIVAYIDENSLLHLPKQSLLKHTKSEGHLFNIYDTAKRVLMYLEKDGTFYFERLKLSNSTIKQIVEEIEPYLDSGANTRNICNFPTTLCRLDLIGDMTGISKNDAVLMDFKFNDYNGFVRYCKAAVTYQGSSSMAYVKKNYAFDLLDENGDSIKLKFGDWVAQDSFHLKANYIDVTHAKNITGARLTEQVYKTRIPSLQRPFNYYDSIDISDLKKRFDSGAMLHIDGFGCELYINGEYQGLYTFNLKKHRDNYQMDKSNPKHILIELADNTSISYPVPWEKWEIRNPKGFSALEEPPQGNVKTSIESFFEWCTTVTTATAKSDIESHLIVPFCLDWWLICQVIDNYDGIYKNTLWGTWDGLHWCPTLYDMDSIFGMLTDGTKIIHSPQVPLTPPDIIAKVETIYLTEIKARYSELRKQGVFTTDNIMRITTDFMLSIGIDAYKKDAKKWAEIPSNRSDGNYPNYPETGGFYESLERQRIWITGRLTFLDNYYAFTNN